MKEIRSRNTAPGANNIESVLLVRSAFGEIHELAWLRALRDLGIRVELFDTHSYIPRNLAGRIEQRYLRGPHIRKVNRMVIERARAMRPDVIHFYQGHHYSAETITAVSQFAFVSGSHDDDPFGRPRFREYRLLMKALCQYDGYHVNRQCNIAEAASYGVKRARVLMMYYIPWLHYPCSLSPQEQAEFGSDVVFAGHMEPDLRIECLSGVIRSGIKCRIFGAEAEWKSALPPDADEALQPGGYARGEDYRRALCASKIGACFFSKWNRDLYTTRAWEIPACGVFLLSERTAPMQEFYREGKEAEFFGSPAEFIDKVRFYLNNDTARERIAKAGYARVIASGNDVYSRMRQWLADVSCWRNEAQVGNHSGALAS
ncbi:MAG TPA: glycosyltransferase [Terracidiphilus sp.]|nr:glycosyltransferase [Terracidiphilus sp.]